MIFTQALNKVGKAVIRATAESTIQSTTNAEFLELNRRKQKKTKRVKGHYGQARYMNQAILDEREEAQAELTWGQVVASPLRLSPDILAPKRPPAPRKKRAPGLIRPAILPPLRSPPVASATAIPSRRAPTAATQATPSKRAYTAAEPIKRPRIAARTAAKRPQKLIVKLRLRVTTAELERGLRGQQGQQGAEPAARSGRARDGRNQPIRER